jgi:nitrite reductase/ring-hydroxylating ferredoxin subunit
MDGKWVKVASSDAVAEGSMVQVDVGGEPVCLYNLGGTMYATQDTCTHEHAFLSEGYIDGDCIECPLHQALFHIPTGAVRSAPATENLRVYPVRVVGPDIEICDSGSPTP